MINLLTIAYGRLVRCRNCGHLARGPNYCEMCGSLLMTTRVLALVGAAYALTLALLLSVLIAAALAAPPAVPAVCMASGHNCHKVEVRR